MKINHEVLSSFYFLQTASPVCDYGVVFIRRRQLIFTRGQADGSGVTFHSLFNPALPYWSAQTFILCWHPQLVTLLSSLLRRHSGSLAFSYGLISLQMIDCGLQIRVPHLSLTAPQWDSSVMASQSGNFHFRFYQNPRNALTISSGASSWAPPLRIPRLQTRAPHLSLTHSQEMGAGSKHYLARVWQGLLYPGADPASGTGVGWPHGIQTGSV